ncbi:hypothetical protein D3C72_1575420 [compost metagenome]
MLDDGLQRHRLPRRDGGEGALERMVRQARLQDLALFAHVVDQAQVGSALLDVVERIADGRGAGILDDDLDAHVAARENAGRVVEAMGADGKYVVRHGVSCEV